jgi:hypothetical protein
MDPLQPDSQSNGRLPDGIQALYPVPPLSWLVPLWSYACGVIASSTAVGTLPPGIAGSTARTASRFAGYSGGALFFLLGLLLAGPLLGVAWGASGQIRCYREQATDPPANAPQKPLGTIPYTVPGSLSHALASRLRAVSTSLQQATPAIGMAPLRLVASTVFSLAVAAELGQRTLAITTVALLYICARSFGRGRRAAPRAQSGAEAPTQILDISLPILITWLIGHATHAALRVESVLVAACFALVLWSCSHIHWTGNGLLRLLLPQALVIAYFIVDRQPVPATAVALLASAQLLWSPLLQTPAGRMEYLRALQLPLVTAMLLSAWTLGYGP